MIGTIDIAVNAANPQLPLTTLAAYVSSPSHVRVLNVPRGIGTWQLTAVALEIAYPDGAVVSVPATRNGAVWSATFPAPVAPGVSTRGFRVVASGVDENGAPVTGYILGMGDVLIFDADGSLAIGDRRVAVRIVDEKPESPREGDLVLASMEIFDGAAWRTLGPTPDIGDLTRVEPYLYEINNAVLDDTFAEAYFRERFEDRPPRLASSSGADNPHSTFGACSCVRIGNEFARAYDWKYDESVSFLVRTKASGTRFASIAVCRSPEGLTRQALESKTAPANLFRVVPYLALDGINENGVTCCVNVIPPSTVAASATGASQTSGPLATAPSGDRATAPSGDRATAPGQFCAVGAVRRVLDRALTAEEGAIAVASSAWMPSASALGGYSLHFMIADSSKTYVVEDGQIFDVSSDAVKAMTNFRVGGRDFLDESGRVDVDKIAEYDPYGTGAERYDALVYRTLHPFAESLREWLTTFKYSDVYIFAETPRPDDFAGVEIEPGVRAKINDTLDLEEWFVDNNIHAKWLDRTRDGTFWQTVHSSVYDIAARSLQLVVQEGDAVHTFPIVKSDSEPADYPTVRTNAAAGAAHAAETDNPHDTTAEQVGVRVVELVVEGDAKKLYLMLNGERTTERVTSYATLLAMAKRGLVRLYYNAVGGTGRKALYTAHMVDDNGTPAMRFDATGTLGEKVYTRSIALTKTGADGIAVTIGALTELQKSLSDAQLANIDAVPQKRDKSDMFTEWTGQTEGGHVVGQPEYVGNGEWHWPMDPEWGVYRLAHGDKDAVSLDFYDGSDTYFMFTATRQRILTTADVTTDLTNPTAGKAADAVAVKTALALRLSLADMTRAARFIGFFNEIVKDGVFVKDVNGGDVFSYENPITQYTGLWYFRGTEKIPSGTNWISYMAGEAGVAGEGLVGLLNLLGSENKHLGQTITELAEAATKSKLSAADADFKAAVEASNAGGLTDSAMAGVFATPAFNKACAYAKGTAVTASAKLADRTFNLATIAPVAAKIDEGEGANKITFTPPDENEGKCRDFLLRVKIGAATATETVVPTIAFALGSAPEGDGAPDWKTGGVYDLAFTEQPDGAWLLKVLDLTPKA